MMIMPAAILNPLADMPKSVKSTCPAIVKEMRIISEVMVARFTICALWALSKPLVIDRNTGMVPNGLAKVKNDVRQINANGNNVSISVDVGIVNFLQN